MSHRPLAAAALVLLLSPATAGAIESTLQLQLSTDQDFERRIVTYDCATETPLTVTYLNAAPNFLALVPVADEPEPLLFVAVISASGARYASGQWVWWTRGPEASLYDATLGEDAPAVLTCSETNEIP
jgi:membrane-bound inhibitor of C-type lysozyme